MFNGEVVIYADGGCEGNGSQHARAFGSYVMRAYRDGKKVGEKRSGRLDFPQHSTNNAAELQIVLEALKALQPGKYPVRIISDSQLVVNVLSGLWQTDKPHLCALVSDIQFKELCDFPNVSYEWVRRDVIVQELGH
jgi:ribonuclease HI